ncbi:hypothetical protein CC85DRAFT_303389 [Cutaneotrichosporon oleaginosum]|uniref:Uncharacterized protein n=1 Tax=Cutaneotrichosporon oleaginosum TaxID=879819 RepID=A0A0J1B139_9TREE|nr:uncharacterized protein CC85DRAFT_303389 [Cutaneotrichosporon oleaginosum]KLT41314.1 hypothetical protein CC85DRAFT_303389 [Cutaneotrichosporon oleaginosum]TXT14064.1 hypothetical protein COLE_00257 [Cutaneotrichosporon oleaginosum]
MSPALVAGTLPTPPSSIQKYRDALRRDLKARYEAAARAGLNARVPADAKHDPDYGYDENPFDTRARLLHSFDPLSPASPPLPRSVSSSSSSLSEEPEPEPQPEPIALNSPAPSIPRRRWSAAPDAVGLASAAMSRSSSLSLCDTPGSEMSFEVGRTADYVGLYGRPSLRFSTAGISPARTPPPPPVVSTTSSHAVFNPSPLGAFNSPLGTFGTCGPSPLGTFGTCTATATPPKDRRSLLGATPLKPLKPLAQLAHTPSPQPRRGRRSRAPDAWADVVLTRSESETMLLAAAGYASQRCRGAIAR